MWAIDCDGINAEMASTSINEESRWLSTPALIIASLGYSGQN
jgi:hypothetical protein